MLQGLVQDRFLLSCTRYGSAICLEYDGGVWSYSDVKKRSEEIGGFLLGAGVRQGDVVAIVAERGPQLVWTALAVLRIGAAFSIIDSSYPSERIDTLLAKIEPAAVLTAGGPAAVAAAKPLAFQARVTGDEADIDASSLSRFEESRNHAQTPAYYLFTSGTTGNPKCVACSHAPLVNFIDWQIANFGLVASDRFTMLSGLSHDPLLRDIFTPLALGAALAIPQQAEMTRPGALRSWLGHATASTIHLTPQLGQLIAAGGHTPSLPAIRHLFWGGDQLPPSLIAAVRVLAPNAGHTNFYGSTETPQAASWYDCPQDLSDDRIPIGRGARGFDILIVDEDGNILGHEREGEVAIKSRYLSMGYVDGGIVCPPDDRQIDPNDGREVYRTGDRGYRRPDGNVVMTGRADDQIKLRGYRVDLSEISATLLHHPNIKSAIALAIGEGQHRRIDAFVVSAAASADPAETLKLELGRMLPSYMVPTRFWFLPEGLPLLPNSKVDRLALLAIAEQARPEPVAVDPGSRGDTPLEKLTSSWSSILHRGDIDGASTFADLGGDSLSYVDTYLAMEQIVGAVPPGWETMPLEDIAAETVPPRQFLSLIDSSITIRAFSMILIVALHLELSRIGEGATAALFMVSGLLFGRTQWENMFSAKKARLMLRPLAAIIPPTAVFTAATLLVDLAHGQHPPISNFFLSADMVDHPAGPLRHQGIYWYVHDLIKLIVCTFIVQSVVQYFRPRECNRLPVILILMVAFCAIRLILPLIFLTSPIDSYLKGLNVFQTGYFANMSLFYIGIAISQSRSSGRKLFLFLFTSAVALGNSVYFGSSSGISMILCTAALLYLPRMLLPRPVNALLYLIASASIYIYLGDLWFSFATKFLLNDRLGLGIDLTNWISALTSIVGGTCIQKLSERIVNAARGQLSAARSREVYPEPDLGRNLH